MDETVKEESKLSKVLNIIVSIISYTIILLCLIISIFAISTKTNNGIAAIGGNACLTVNSESMTGTIDKGDLIFIKTITFDDKEKVFVDNDKKQITFVENKTIATFYCDINGDNKLDIVTHKYIGMEGNSYKFQGTYIKAEDKGAELRMQYVSANSIIGVYEGKKIGGVGSLINFLQSSVGFFVCFVLPIFLFVCYRGYKLIIAIKESKLENAVEAGKLTEEERNRERERIREEILKELEAQQNEEKN